MAQKLLTKSHLIKWCDKQVKDGKELKLCWEGGNDSGWVYMEIDGEQIDYTQQNRSPEMQALVNLMDEQLDYGSWAGDFNADGEAVYDAKTKSFVGTDNYSQDDQDDWESDIVIRIPKSIWFDRLEVMIENESVDVSAAFVIKNGFLTPEHDEVIQNVIAEIKRGADKSVDEFCKAPGQNDFRTVWMDEQFDRSDFYESGDNLIKELSYIPIGTYQIDEKEVILQLTTADYE